MKIARNSIIGFYGVDDNTVPQWSSANNYSRGDYVRYGNPQQYYKARFKISSGGLPPSISPAWENMGPVLTNLSAGTNARASLYPSWSSGSSYSIGDVVYDVYGASDYICMVAHSSSSSGPSSNPIDSATSRPRWQRLGAANAFKMLDGQSITRTVHDGATLTANVKTTPAALVGIFGIRGCSQVTAQAFQSDASTQVDVLRTFNLAYSSDTGNKSKLVFDATTAESTSGVVWKFVFTKASGAEAVEVGMIAAGSPVEFGWCKVQPRISSLSFSRTQYDEEFGNIDFVKRGFANEVSCEIYTDQDRQDFLITQLNSFQGEPVIIDLNNAGEHPRYEHLSVWGFYEKYDADYYGWTNADTMISLTIKSLVED